MSQLKVDAYKETKKTRKQDVAKQKKAKAFERVLGTVIAIVVAAALLVGVGITVYNLIDGSLHNTSGLTATSYILDDLSGIQPTEETTEAAK